MIRDIFIPADILLPEGSYSEKWSVIACDQFSSERDYWERVRERVAGEPSTFNMIIPEAYLEEIDEEQEIKKIRAAMDDYLKRGVLREIRESFIYVERTQPDGRVRRGIVGTVDLEEYEFSRLDALILASEGTVLERLPARIRIRRAARLELPHVMAFIDDADEAVIEPLAQKTDSLPLLYDFELMEGGGRIKGWQVAGREVEAVIIALRKLFKRNNFLMVIGDGNHSLAGAKVYWDEIKTSLTEAERLTHPARRALLEVNNVYDPAISFEAIHRVITGVDAEKFAGEFIEALPPGSDYELRWVYKGGGGSAGVKADSIGAMIAAVQAFIDGYIERTGCKVDYIHGEEALTRLAGEDDAFGILLPAMDKSGLFATVGTSGVFPRKSFSVGHARDKRYYLECRDITK